MPTTQQVIKEFSKSCVRLASHLKADGTLDPDDQLAIENHILIVQIAMTLVKYSKASAPIRSSPYTRIRL